MSGRLLVVATPIGNLGDLSPRAREALRSADVIAAEDTRHTRKLLTHFAIATPLVSYHAHSPAVRGATLLARLAAGETVALVSDAGTPGICDPGEALIAAAVAQGSDVSVVPGPVALIAALVGSGLPTARFAFEGFLPRKGKERRERLAALGSETRTVVFYESPQRLADTLGNLAAVQPIRTAVVARELTKLHETFHRGTLEALAAQFTAQPPRGECVVVLAPAAIVAPSPDLEAAVAHALAAGLSPSAAARAAAAETGHPRKAAYAMALSLAGAER